MTRINVVPVEDLCDQHLFAEFRELTRVPNGLLSGRLKPTPGKIPKQYTVRTNANPAGGKGHEYFFTDKLKWLHHRYLEIQQELFLRDYNVTPLQCFDSFGESPFLGMYNDYRPTAEAIELNRVRLIEMFPRRATYFKKPAVICVRTTAVFTRGVAMAAHRLWHSPLGDEFILVGVNKA